MKFFFYELEKKFRLSTLWCIMQLFSMKGKLCNREVLIEFFKLYMLNEFIAPFQNCIAILFLGAINNAEFREDIIFKRWQSYLKLIGKNVKLLTKMQNKSINSMIDRVPLIHYHTKYTYEKSLSMTCCQVQSVS